jgi:hypothetical protein
MAVKHFLSEDEQRLMRTENKGNVKIFGIKRGELWKGIIE